MADVMLVRRKPSLLARIGGSLRSYWQSIDPLSKRPYNLNTIADRVFGEYGSTSAGTVVNDITAFTCSALWDGVSTIAGDVASQSLVFYKWNEKTGAQPNYDSKLYKLLHDEPNSDMTAVVFRRTVTAHALVCGNGYAEIERDAGGRPVALWPIHPNRVRVVRLTSRSPLQYEIDGRTMLDQVDVLHIQGLGCDGVQGYNMIAFAREALGLALASEKFASSFFGNGTRFGGVVSSDQDLDDQQVEAIMKRIAKLHQSADKAFRLLVLGAGFKFAESGVAPNDAQMREIRDQQVYEIARFLGIPPHKLKQLDRATFSNIEQQDLEYYKGPILRWDTVWEQELNRKLVPMLEYGRQFFKHKIDTILRGDIVSRYTALGIARDKGIINADEWRELEDMNPQPGGQGQLYLVQSAQIPVDRLAALTDAQIESTKAKANPPAPQPANDVAQEQVNVANDRAARAEALAEESRQAVASLREQLAAKEASGTAQADELAALRSTIERQQAISLEQTALADTLRERAELVQTAKDLADAERQSLTEAKGAIEADLEAARDRVAQAEQQIGDLMRERELRDEQHASALAEVEAAAAQMRAALSAAEGAFGASEVEKQAVIDALRAMEAQAEARQRMATEIMEARAAAETRATAVEADLQSARADVERLSAEVEQSKALQAQIDLMQTTLAEQQSSHLAALEALKAAQAHAELTAVREREAREAAEVAAADEATRAAESVARAERRAADAAALSVRVEQAERDAIVAQQAAEAERAERERLAFAISEHRSAERMRVERRIASDRGLIVDALGRMTRREAALARRHQATPQKLRTWLDGFDALHSELCMEALLPAVRAHLGTRQSDEDPAAATAAIVTAHLADLHAQLETVLRAEPEDYHATLERVLNRWEADHAGRVADRLMAEQLAYLRALDAQERSA